MKKHLLLILLLTVSVVGFSQTSNVIDISYEATKTDSIGIAGDTLYDLTVIVFVIDTVNTSKVVLKIGSTSGSSNLFNGTYHWNNSSLNSPSNCTYSRKGIEVKLEIKKIVFTNSYFTGTTINSSGVEDTPFIKQ
jgi:hypothetical protein